MTVTNVTPSSLAKNSSALRGAGTTLVVGATDYMRVINATPERLVLIVTNTDDDTDLTFTVLAGDNPPALRAGQGNLAVTVAFGTERWIGPLESDKYLQDDGAIHFYSSVNSGKVHALKLPRGSA